LNLIIREGHTVSDSFEDYVTVDDVAARLNIHPESVRRLIRNKKLPARKFANTWLVKRAILEQFASHYDPRPGKKATLL
jgi:excisionase family DNA binding protein